MLFIFMKFVKKPVIDTIKVFIKNIKGNAMNTFGIHTGMKPEESVGYSLIIADPIKKCQ